MRYSRKNYSPCPKLNWHLKKFYAWTAKSSNEFIKDWFAFDAHLKNILTAINGRKFNLPYAQYLIGESETVEKLSKSHTADFGLGKEDDLYNALVRIYEQNNILYRERGYDIYAGAGLRTITFSIILI